MNKQESIADWKRMYDSLTDPEQIEKNKQRADREKRREERMADTGLYVV